jgi:cation diffusion facilitator CzcD-associated flavoprotein CzcO
MTVEQTDYDVVVLGAGFSGIYLLWRLRESGFRAHTFEANAGLGGVWFNNCYPGARVDSHVPNYEFSMEPVWRDWNWSERFPGRQELQRYFVHVANVLGLHDDISLSTRVVSASFDDDADVWRLETDDGQRVTTRFFMPCTGFASRPYVPDLAGLDSFEGISHHTARWPRDGVDLAGRHVAIIGTGASGVQVMQEAAKVAASVTVFQRTPVTALPMGQRQFTRAEHEAAKAEYPAQFVARNTPPGSFTDIARADVAALDVSEAERLAVYEEMWSRGGFHFWAGTFNDVGIDPAANRTAYDFWRDKTRARIDDPAVADILAPMEPIYPFGTKRPSLEQDYYDLFNQDNVAIVDLRADPIDAVTPAGIQVAGVEYPADVLVLATGFDANTGGLTQIDIRGRDGLGLADAWSDGVQTHLGIAVAGFPNMMFLYGPQSPTAFCNGPTCAEHQGDWVAECLVHLRAEGLTRIESSTDADREWTGTVDMIGAVTLLGETDSWYMSANIPGKRRQLLNYPLVDDYLERLAASAERGYADFVLG